MKFVVVGGVATRLHGAPILTRDLDITPHSNPRNLRALAAALTELGARLRSPSDPEGVPFPIDGSFLAANRSWTFTTRCGDLDLVFEPAGTCGYEDLVADAEVLRVALDPPLEVPVASLADIIRSKEAAGREKDRAMLPLLRRTLEELIAGGVAADQTRDSGRRTQ